MIVAGGLMAGGALGGVFGAALRLLPKYSEELIQTPFYSNEPISQTISAIMFVGLCLYLWFASVQRKEGCLMDQLSKYIADAVLGIDTLWGGDVMCASGTGRFIADSWYSDEPLPAAYTAASAARVRETGGVGGKTIDREAVDQYLREVNIPDAVAGVRKEADKIGGLRGQYLPSLADCVETMWDLAMEILGKGPAVPYARSVEASTGKAPEPSKPEAKRERVAELLGRAGYRQLRRCACMRSMPGGVSASRRWDRCKRDGSGGHRTLRQPERGESDAVPAQRTGERFRAPTSTSCPSRTPGSPVR